MPKIENQISWCDDTTNCVTGCDKVSPGCKNCYAATGTRARVLRAQGIETWGAKGVRHPVAQFAAKIRSLNKKCVCDKCHEAYPIKRLQTAGGTPAARCGCGGALRRIRLFADSNSDWLDEKWPIGVFADFLNEIRLAPNVDVLLLTKRPENFVNRMQMVTCHFRAGVSAYVSTPMIDCLEAWNVGNAPENLWLGVSVENQAMADLRIPQLMAIPAAVRFLSCEPLLEAVDLNAAIVSGQLVYATKREADSHLLHWVIVGGESGKDRRDCGVEAICSVAAQCCDFGVPVYVKQDCAFKSGEQGRLSNTIWALKQFPDGRRSASVPTMGGATRA